MPSTIYPRFEIDAVAPGAERALSAFDHFVAGSGLDPTLLELVRVRAVADQRL
jgi:hypothetical protein